MLSLLLALAPVGGALQQPYALDVADLNLGSGTATPTDEYIGLVPGNSLEFRVSGQPGEPVLVSIGRDLVPTALAGVESSLAGSIVLGTMVLDARGQGSIDVRVPLDLPLGARLRSQAFGPDRGAPGQLAGSNSIQHESTDLQGEVLVADVKSIHPMAWTGGVLTIENAASWAEFWNQHDGGTPQQPLPEVDFERQFVAASFYGIVGTTGYSIELLGVDVNQGGLTLQQKLNTPGFGCGGGFSMGFPHVFVALDRVALEANVSAVTGQFPGEPCN